MIRFPRITGRRVAALSALAGALVVVTPMAAAAETVPADVALIAGEGAANISPGVQLLGGSGSYTFAGPGVLVSVGDPTDVTDSGLKAISSSGAYANTVCGTGTADGSAATGEFTVNYHIQFVAGQGVLTGTAIHEGKSATVAGAATIVPTTGNCVTAPVTQFTVGYVIVGGGLD